MLKINNTAYTNSSVISISDGLNSFQVYCNDSANNLGSGSQYFTVDTQAPVISIVYPVNTTLASQTNFTVNANEALTNCSFMLNGAANVTMIAINSTAYRNNTIVTSSQGLNYVIFYCNDSANNLGNSGLRYYTVDTVAPTITFVSPANATYNNKNFNLTVNANEVLTNCSYSYNGAANITMVKVNNTAYANSSVISIGEGFSTFRVYCNDSANNLGNNMVSFTVDTAVPTITFVSPSNTTYNNKNFNLTVNANEAMTNCSYSLNGAANVTMLSINATAYRNNSVISIPEGLNRFIVYCNDTANNLANNAISFTVDTVTPTIAIIYPANTTS